MHKFRKAARRWTGQLDANGITDATVDHFGLLSAVGLPTDTEVDLVLHRVDASGKISPTTEEGVTGMVFGNRIINVRRGVTGTAQAHPGNTVVEVILTAAQWNDMTDGILLEHNQDGTHKRITEDEWISTQGTWTATAARAISVAGINMTEIIRRGDKIKVINGSELKYFYVTSLAYQSANNLTVMTVAGVKDLIAGAIEGPLYSSYALYFAVSEMLTPITTIREFGKADNPADLLGFGTWELHGPGRTTVCFSSSEPEFDSLGKTGGSKTHKLTAAESGLPSHGHNAWSGEDSPDHTHNYQNMVSIVDTGDETNRYGIAIGGGPISTGTGGATARHYHSISVANSSASSASAAHNNLSPYIVTYRWIRTA